MKSSDGGWIKFGCKSWWRIGQMIPPHATGEATRITPEMENPGTHQPGTLHKANLPAEPRSLWDPFGFVCDPK